MFARLRLSPLGLFCVGGLLLGCRSSHDNPGEVGGGFVAQLAGGVCAAGRIGCPCDSPGSTATCSAKVAQLGDYVTCGTGVSVCEGGTWGACNGKTLYTRSLVGRALGPGGLHTLTAGGFCNDPCDPTDVPADSGSGAQGCQLAASTGDDVDASGLYSSDGALSLALPCVGLACQVNTACPPNQSTALSGVVFDPSGQRPVYGAYVYVPTNPALAPFSSGASCLACDAEAASLNAVSIARTGPDGTFFLTNVPATDVAPNNPIPLVVQMGKWRREVMLSTVPSCTATAVDPDSSRLPRSSMDTGVSVSLPRMALVTGGEDPLECALVKMGIEPSEFQVPGSGGRSIDYYRQVDGRDLFDPARPLPAMPPVAPYYATLVSDAKTLEQYDIVLLPSPSHQDDGTDAYADNLGAYVNAGGRVLATHYSYTWLAASQGKTAKAINPVTSHANPFYGTAAWDIANTLYPFPVDSTIDTTVSSGRGFVKGQAFLAWLEDVHATPAAPGVLSVQGAAHDVDAVQGPSVEWAHDANPPGEPFAFSFNTPVGSAAPCGRFTFSELEAPRDDVVDVQAQGQCATTADCGYTATCSPAKEGTCAPFPCMVSDFCLPGYTCRNATPGSCVEVSACTDDAQCQSRSCQKGTCDPPTAKCLTPLDCGEVEACQGGIPGTCQASCTQDADCAGELCVDGKCMGCHRYSDCQSGQCQDAIPPLCSANADAFPLSCRQTPMSPQELALEFLLLDATACVTPDTAPPPAVPPGWPPPVYSPQTFTEEFASSCVQGTHAVWRKLEWNAVIPDSASIVFIAQTQDAATDGAPPDWSESASQMIPLVTATRSTTSPADVVALDVWDMGRAADAGAATSPDAGGAFNAAMPPVTSKSQLLLTVTLNPTTDQRQSPRLLDWRVTWDCLPTE